LVAVPGVVDDAVAVHSNVRFTISRVYPDRLNARNVSWTIAPSGPCLGVGIDIGGIGDAGKITVVAWVAGDCERPETLEITRTQMARHPDTEDRILLLAYSFVSARQVDRSDPQPGRNRRHARRGVLARPVAGVADSPGRSPGVIFTARPCPGAARPGLSTRAQPCERAGDRPPHRSHLPREVRTSPLMNRARG
jgi:hypothetical protein